MNIKKMETWKRPFTDLSKVWNNLFRLSMLLMILKGLITLKFLMKRIPEDPGKLDSIVYTIPMILYH